MEASLAQGYAHFFSGCSFMVGLGKPKLCIKFEVPTFSSCVNNEVKPKKNWGAPLAQGHAHFSYGCDFMMGLGKPKLCAKFRVASFSHCVNIEEEPQILGSSPRPGPSAPFLLRVIL